MCESTAYLLTEGKEELILESVDQFKTLDGHVHLVNIFGEEKKIKAIVKKLSLVDHRIYLEPVQL